MTFLKKDFQIYKNWITIIPTIQIHINNAVYREKNISIEFGWLVFHARLMWKESEK